MSPSEVAGTGERIASLPFRSFPAPLFIRRWSGGTSCPPSASEPTLGDADQKRLNHYEAARQGRRTGRGPGPRDVPRVLPDPERRFHQLGRPGHGHPEPPDHRAVVVPLGHLLHDLYREALPSAGLGVVRHRQPAIRPQRHGFSPDQSRHSPRQHGARLLVVQCPDPESAGWVRHRGLVRVSSDARRIGGLDLGTERRALRRVLLGGAAQPHLLRPAQTTLALLARSGALWALAALQVHGGNPAGGAAAAGLVPGAED